MDLLTFANIAAYLCVINFVAFASFGIDKWQAEKGWRRTSEATLLKLTFFGGTAGSYAGRALFRHKTRKQPFSRRLHMIAAVQLVTLLFALAALSLAACGAQEDETSYKAGMDEVSGGELIVTEEDPDATEVDLPETAMTPVPVEEGETAEASAE